MMVVSEHGKLLKNYRKHQLFHAEYGWATPGEGFAYLDARVWRHDKTVRFGLGICNDIWYLPPDSQSQMKFAKFHEENQCQVILHMSNWPDYHVYANEQIKT